jgi:hypothetical protein
VALAAWQVFDFTRLQRSAPLKDLAGTFGIARDVGLIGFFSESTILDANGLVNGREIARMPMQDRLRTFVSAHPVEFVFANTGQLRQLEGILDVHHWTSRGSFDFPNFGGDIDRHYLLVRD